MKYRDKSRTPFPAKFHTDTNTKGISICTFVFADPPVTVLCAPVVVFKQWRWSFGYTLAGSEAWWERWTQEGLWRAPGSYTQSGRGRLRKLPWSYTHGKYGPSQDSFRKVRTHEKSRLVKKNHKLLNTTQIHFFYHCIAVLPRGPKHE